MADDLRWDDEDVAHTCNRSTRYPGATDIQPEWTLQAAADPARVVGDPDPRSAVGYVRLVGYSADVGFVVMVIIDPHDFSGVTAWKTRGADLRRYLERTDSQHE